MSSKTFYTILSVIILLVGGYALGWYNTSSSLDVEINEYKLRSTEIRDSFLIQLEVKNSIIDSLDKRFDSVSVVIHKTDSLLKQREKVNANLYEKIMGSTTDSSYNIIIKNIE